jgi:4-hydroxy-tetrahydrodipicolinate reductase
MQIRVLVVGLGPIGLAIAGQVASRRAFHLVGGVDLDPQRAGRDLGDLIGLDAPLRVQATTDLRGTIRATSPDVAVLCTSSSLQAALPVMEEVLRQRLPIVTTTEEAAYPTPRTRRLAARLDAAAQEAGVAVLGTGVNPGFAMDALPIALTAACERVDRIEVRRVQDARIRRQPFQAKIGAGLTVTEFADGVEAGRIRHIGFAQSIQMIADSVGWRVDDVAETVEPKLATARVSSEFYTAEPGRVAGLVQTAIGYRDGDPLITLRLEAYLGAPESYDSILIEGSPRLHSRIEGGVHGDIATASMAVNAIPMVVVAPPGLRTMRDVRLPSFYGG